MIIDLDSIKKIVEYHFKTEQVKGFDPNLPADPSDTTAMDNFNKMDPRTGTILPPDPILGAKYKLINKSDQWKVKETKSQNRNIRKSSAGAPISDDTVIKSWSYNDSMAAMRDSIANIIYDVLTDTTTGGTQSTPGVKTSQLTQTMLADDPALPVSVTVVKDPDVIVGAVEGTPTKTANSKDIKFKAPSPQTGEPAPNVILESHDGSHWVKVNDVEVEAGNSTYKVIVNDMKIDIGKADGTLLLRIIGNDIQISDDGSIWKSLFSMVNNHRHQLTDLLYSPNMYTTYTSLS